MLFRSDQEHEMSDVSHRNSLDEPRERRRDRPRTYATAASPNSNAKSAAAPQDGVELRPYVDVWGGPFPKSPASGRLPPATPSTPTKQQQPKAAVYVSQEHGMPVPEAIRTSQLEPSPVMQLPLRPRASRDG